MLVSGKRPGPPCVPFEGAGRGVARDASSRASSVSESVLQPTDALAAVEKEMAQHSGVALALCGDAVCLDAFASVSQERGWTVLRGCEHISAASVAECGWQKLQRGEILRNAAEIHKLAPLYLRASDPELKLERRQASA